MPAVGARARATAQAANDAPHFAASLAAAPPREQTGPEAAPAHVALAGPTRTGAGSRTAGLVGAALRDGKDALMLPAGHRRQDGGLVALVGRRLCTPGQRPPAPCQGRALAARAPVRHEPARPDTHPQQ